MTNHIEGKVIVVTGAAAGFGRLVCALTAARGARVVGADIDASGLQTVIDHIQAAGGAAAACRADVTSKAQMDALASFALERYGRIDVMVNNAGIMPLAFYADHAAAAAAWDRCIDINFKGVLNGIAAVYDAMIAQGRGHVVNISSIYGNFPNAGAAVYTATKAAVNILSEALRVESQGKIKVSVIRPTGVPATGLGATIVNPEAIVGIVGHHQATFGENLTRYLSGELPAERRDADSIRYWAITPEQLAEQVVYVINQPWGVSISDITVRASGEDFVL
jgi:NADP-dependent 3-hydroxy acid dehydrogenase YdfG